MSGDKNALRDLTDYLDSTRDWDVATHLEYERLRNLALAERDAITAYAGRLDRRLRLYESHSEVVRMREGHGITLAVLEGE